MITVIQAPSKYTPSDNPVVFQVESDDANIVYFEVEVLEATTNSTISKLDIYITPDYTTGSYINLSRILQNLVNWDVNNSINILCQPIKKSLLAYKLKLTERGLDEEGVIVDLNPATTLPDTYYVWNAKLDRISFASYNMPDYLITTGLPAKFLTKKPNNAVVNEFSCEQLYFLQDGENALNIVVKTYNSAGTLLNTYTAPVTDLDEYAMFRLQVSPKALEEGLFADFTDVDKYTVHLEDEDAARKTEIRTYYFKSLPCHLEPTNLLWVNSLGGVDSYQFYNVQATINYSKVTVKKNIFKVDEGFYSDRTGDIFNAAEELIDVQPTGSYTAYTGELSDDESAWLHEVFNSKKVFVELSDTSLAPVLVQNNTYQVQKQKYVKGSLVTTSLTYTFNGEILPAQKAGSTGGGFGSGRAQVEFIDNQMNALTDFDTILTFESSVIDGVVEKVHVSGAVAATNANLKFEFNKIEDCIQLNQNMAIYVNNAIQMSVDFLGDYLGRQFRFTSIAGIQYYGTFKNGNVYF